VLDPNSLTVDQLLAAPQLPYVRGKSGRAVQRRRSVAAFPRGSSTAAWDVIAQLAVHREADVEGALAIAAPVVGLLIAAGQG
jgi:hypothetical protein